MKTRKSNNEELPGLTPDTTATAKQPGGNAIERTQTRDEVNLSVSTIDAIATQIADKLVKQLLPVMIVHSRLCAADTVRTCQRPDTVFRLAIKEAECAMAELDKYHQAASPDA